MDPRTLSWANPWVRQSVLWLAVLVVCSNLVAFVVLPMAQKSPAAQGLWASICRAAGVPVRRPADAADIVSGAGSTDVVLLPAMAKPGNAEAAGRGGTIALGCTPCHGAQGMSTSGAPNLAGQYPEVIEKELLDFKGHKRGNVTMEAIAGTLSQQAIHDLAAYFAYLPKARVAPTTYAEALPALVRVGDPLRNIAPCLVCHGQIDRKLGAPWIEAMPKPYLVAQLQAFRSGERHNDAEAQMRNMARSLTDAEIDAVSGFYAAK